MYCTKCGHEIPDNAKFCTKCGNQIAKPIVEKADKSVKKAKKPKVRWWIIVSIICAVVLLVAGGIFLYKYLENGKEVEEEIEIEEEEEDIVEEPEEEEEDIVEEPEDEEITVEEWCEAYASYIARDGREGGSYALIDVNGDSIYELVIEGTNEAEGNVILTYNEDGIDELQTARLSFDFVPGGNVLRNSDGHMGYYYDDLYTIEDGRWFMLESGWYEMDSNNEYDDYGWMNLNYFWDGASVSKSDYYTRLQELYDFDGAQTLGFTIDKNSMLDDLKSYSPELVDTYNTYFEESDEIHTYEIVVADVNAEDAFWYCKEKGGYLVHINGDEEYQFIIDLIRSEGYEDKIFWLGARRDYIDGSFRWSAPYKDGWYPRDPITALDEDEEYLDYWLEGEPSYVSEGDGDDKFITEEYVDMFYSKKEGRFVWNDVPADLVGTVPAYKGKIAYICEYD